MSRPLERAEPAQPLLNFTSRHMDIIRRLVAGQTQRVIAQEMGYTEGRLSIIINSPLFQIKLKAFEKQVNDRVVDNVANFEKKVRELQTPALETISGLMERSKNERLRRDCAKDVLELGGNIKKERDADGMNEFARIIADAFKSANERNAQRTNHLEEGRLIEITPEPTSEPEPESGIEVEVELEEDSEAPSIKEQANPPLDASSVEPREKQTINRILNAFLKD
jgi:hypothetical protein